MSREEKCKKLQVFAWRIMVCVLATGTLVLSMLLSGCSCSGPAQSVSSASDSATPTEAAKPWEPDFVASEQEPAAPDEQAAMNAAVLSAEELVAKGIVGSKTLQEPIDAYFFINPETHQASISFSAISPSFDFAIAQGNELARLLDYCARYHLLLAGLLEPSGADETAALSLEPADVGFALFEAAAQDDEILDGHLGLEYISLGKLYDTYDITLYCDDGSGKAAVEGYKPAGAGIPITWQ